MSKNHALPYPVWVCGDLRAADGPTPYDRVEGKMIIAFGGGAGFYHFCRKQYKTAIKAWKHELSYVLRLEKWTGQRQHKGWFYFYIAQAAGQLGDTETMDRYMAQAREEDRLSYGEQAESYPAMEEREKITA